MEEESQWVRAAKPVEADPIMYAPLSPSTQLCFVQESNSLIICCYTCLSVTSLTYEIPSTVNLFHSSLFSQLPLYLPSCHSIPHATSTAYHLFPHYSSFICSLLSSSLFPSSLLLFSSPFTCLLPFSLLFSFSPFSSLPFSFFLLSLLPSFLVCVSEKKDPTSVAVRPTRTRDLNNVLLPASPAYSQSGNEDRIILPPRYVFKLFSVYYCLMIVKCHLGSMDKHLSVTDMCSQCTDIQSTASPVFCTRLKNTVTLYFILISSTICLLPNLHSHYSHYLSF